MHIQSLVILSEAKDLRDLISRRVRPKHRSFASLAGVETLVSTRLDPGVDPVVEADRRGAILAIVRLGNKDLQAPGAQGQERRYAGRLSVPDRGRAPTGGADADGHARGRIFHHAHELHVRRDRAAIWDADVRHSDWSARTALGARWECPPACRSTPSSTTRPFICRSRPRRCGSMSRRSRATAIRSRSTTSASSSGPPPAGAVTTSPWRPPRVRRAPKAPARVKKETCPADVQPAGSSVQVKSTIPVPPPTTRDNGPIDPLSGNQSEGLQKSSRQDGPVSARLFGPGDRCWWPNNRLCTISIKALCHRERLAAGNSSGADHCPGSFSQLRSRPRRGP